MELDVIGGGGVNAKYRISYMIHAAHSVISRILTWYWGLDAHNWLGLLSSRGATGILPKAIGTMQPGAVRSRRITRGLLNRPYCQS